MITRFFQHPKIVLGGCFLLGLCLRLINLNRRGIWYDDAFSYFLARQPFEQIIKGTAADTMPPVYYFSLHLWMQISQEIWFLRLLSVLLDLACLVLLFLLVKQLAGRNAAIWAVFFGAISPLQIYHAQELRMYTFLALGQLGYLYCFSWIWKNKGKRAWLNWAGFVGFATIAMYSHNLAIFVLVVPDIFLVARKNWKLLVQLLLAQLMVGIIALPWLLFLPGQIEKIQFAFWTQRPGLVEILQALELFTVNLPLPDNLLLPGFFISLLVLVCIILGLVFKRDRDEGNIQFLIFLCIIPPLLLFIVSYVMRPVFVTRGFLTSALIYLGLAGVVAAQRKLKGIQFVLPGLFIAGACIALPYQLTYSEFPRSPFQEVTVQLTHLIRAGDIVLHDNKLSYFPSKYYAPDLQQVFLPDEPGSPNDTFAPASQSAMNIFPAINLQSAVNGHDRIYFVVFSKTISEYKQAGLADHPVLTWLKSNFRQGQIYTFNDLLVFQFIR